MTHHASGPFEVKLTPQETGDKAVGGTLGQVAMPPSSRSKWWTRPPPDHTDQLSNVAIPSPVADLDGLPPCHLSQVLRQLLDSR
jgi:hypothetical protein